MNNPPRLPTSCYKAPEVFVRDSQMIGFGDGSRYDASFHFGNPLDLEKILEWELKRLSKGLQTKVTITGVPYKAFYKAYSTLKKEKGILTVRHQCQSCEGAGTTKEYVRHLKHWSGVQMYAFAGRFFTRVKWCKACEGAGYREFLARGGK